MDKQTGSHDIGRLTPRSDGSDGTSIVAKSEVEASAPLVSDACLSLVSASTPLSKTAQKRLARQQEKCEFRRLQKQKRERTQVEAVPDACDSAPVTAAQLAQAEFARDERQRKKQEQDGDFCGRCDLGPMIAIDCDFEELMNDREVNSMCQQIMRSYGANRKATEPVRLCLVGQRRGGKVESCFAKICGAVQWLAFATHERSVTEVFSLESLVYLTSESEHEIESLDPAKVYVIGGIVDRNRHKGCTYNKAVAGGVKTARLPIDSAFLELSSSKVLAMNHVVEILLEYRSSGSWANAIVSALPNRKRGQKAADAEED